jgi:hypothetical protein
MLGNDLVSDCERSNNHLLLSETRGGALHSTSRREFLRAGGWRVGAGYTTEPNVSRVRPAGAPPRRGSARGETGPRRAAIEVGETDERSRSESSTTESAQPCVQHTVGGPNSDGVAGIGFARWATPGHVELGNVREKKTGVVTPAFSLLAPQEGFEPPT